MAQVRAADRAGTDDFAFVAMLAEAPAGELLDRLDYAARTRRDCRGSSTTPVPRLVSALVTTGVLFQPVHRALRATGVFCFGCHAPWIGVAAGW